MWGGRGGRGACACACGGGGGGGVWGVFFFWRYSTVY